MPAAPMPIAGSSVSSLRAPHLDSVARPACKPHFAFSKQIGCVSLYDGVRVVPFSSQLVLHVINGIDAVFFQDRVDFTSRLS